MKVSSGDPNHQNLMTPGQLAEYLQCSLSHVYNLTSMEQIPCLKIGRLVRFRKDQIDRWLQSQERRPRKRVTIRM